MEIELFKENFIEECKWRRRSKGETEVKLDGWGQEIPRAGGT